MQALHPNGYVVVDHDPDYVVVGEGRTFNLEQVDAAVRMIVDGAKLIATNLDPNCPTEGPAPGLRGHGRHAGDGHRSEGLQRRQAQPGDDARRPQGTGPGTEETTMIGDTMETDILGGVQLGYRTVLVLSGGTSREDLDCTTPIAPTSSSTRSPICGTSKKWSSSRLRLERSLPLCPADRPPGRNDLCR